MTESRFKEFELTLHQKRRTDDLLQKITSRKRLKASHVKRLIKKNAEQIIADKRKKKMKTKRRKEYNNMMKIWRMKRDEMHAKEVLTRKNEKTRLKQIKEMTKRNIFTFVEMMTSISNPKTEWKNFNDIWNAKQAKKQIIKQKDDDDDVVVEFIVNTADNSDLEMSDDELHEQADFVSFDFEDDENDVDLNDEDNYSS